jgi:hypothetical protein
MITYAQIAELSDQTSLPLIQIIRALARSAGDSDVARARLTDGDDAVQAEESCPREKSPPDGA